MELLNSILTLNLGKRGENFMLVKNMTKTPLKIKSFKGTKLILPPLKVINVDEYEFPAERIKKLFGKYVYILTDKVETPVKEEVKADATDVPTETKKDLETEKDNGAIQPAPEAPAAEEKVEDTGVKVDDGNTPGENGSDDNGDANGVVAPEVEKIETETDGEKADVVEAGEAETTEEKPKRGRKKKEKEE